MRATERMILTAALLGAAACTPVDAGLGDAVRQNYAAQVIDPDPQYRGTPLEAGSGARAALAMKRYRTGTVKNPKPQTGADPFSGGGQQDGGGGEGNGGGGTPPM